MLDAVSLKRYMQVNGWKLTTDVEKADVILLGTCGFDVTSEDKSLKFISRAQKKKRNDSVIAVFGCLSDINKAAIEPYDVVPISYRNMNGIDDLINAKTKFNESEHAHVLHEENDYFIGGFSGWDRFQILFMNMIHRPERLITYLWPGYGPRSMLPWFEKSYYIKIEKGCLGACTYCAIRNAAGRTLSQSSDDILHQFQTGLDKGYKMFRLLGEDVGAYGLDIGSNIIELLHSVFSFNHQFKIVIEDLSPRWIIHYWDDFRRLMNLYFMRIHHIVIPVQSGSQKILRAMKRGYRVTDVEKIIHELRQINPSMSLSTHVIVGFPGETRSDYQKTVAFLERTSFNDIVAHRYADRPNTTASTMPDKVTEFRKIKRIWKLRLKFPKTCRIRI
jgi:tRNA A37 methylthiotransferase MiaB